MTNTRATIATRPSVALRRLVAPGESWRDCKPAGGEAALPGRVLSVLAYVFWHTPGSVDAISTDEAALATFHGSLDPADISGFCGSQVCLVQGAVWVSSPVVYEDWYLVDDFTAPRRTQRGCRIRPSPTAP